MRFLFLFVIWLPAAAAIGQVLESPEEALGRGAGAYFAGRFSEAEKYLSQAIEFVPSDPRGHYLRGLLFVQQGDLTKARIDLAEGARLELRGGYSGAAIDRSLAAVQGASRVMLERIRREVRHEALVDQRNALLRDRRRVQREREKRVLRSSYALPMETLVNRLTPAQAQRVVKKDFASSAALIANTKRPESPQTGETETGKTGFMAAAAPAGAGKTDAPVADSDGPDPFADDPFADGNSTEKGFEEKDAELQRFGR